MQLVTMGRERDGSANGGTSVQRSFRLSERTMKLLDDRARELSESRNSLAERLLDEGLHTERHPMIVFRSGVRPTPPRARRNAALRMANRRYGACEWQLDF